MINDDLPTISLHNATLISGEQPIPRRINRFTPARTPYELATFRHQCARQMVQNSYRQFLFIPKVANLAETLAILVAKRSILSEMYPFGGGTEELAEVDEMITSITNELYQVIGQLPADLIHRLMNPQRLPAPNFPLDLLRTEQNEDEYYNDYIDSLKEDDEEEVDWLREGF